MTSVLIAIGIFFLLISHAAFELIRGLEEDMEGY